MSGGHCITLDRLWAPVALIDPNEQTTLEAGSDTKPRRIVLAAHFRIADFTSESKAYRARNRRFESISLHRGVRCPDRRHR